ncbi:unnamed protein product [Peronospora effusa]|uniref:Uncharacterized protein n=1 Tax=Peronospora effusa TaxID=542832 RepID=A0A3M6VPH3_9STRA|nr:hypothetical protein DD238_003118 [Peronospora effusa]CAI5701762.1 unnamed protein product [Peronospora effusa]
MQPFANFLHLAGTTITLGVAMHPTSTASFFPTAKELSSGVQWFKDHPVLAAAAATAVSVITYLNTLELAEKNNDVQLVDDDVAAAAAVAVVGISNRHRKRTLNRRKGFSGVASDCKLSAAVSWCDEHGGSLTQVFENNVSVLHNREKRLDDTDSDDEARDNVPESIYDTFQQHRATLAGGLTKSVTTQQLDAVTAAAMGNDSDVDAVQTDSPQWGWYVPITPPQDQFYVVGHD